ncbi:Tyrosine-protein phosphatase domain-containing protein [Heracleum sosnowskyi]|uniref:Tyrosine-protein phosphatase domain-containing protein n=1 Tax=Heracleum sosnowskyi TaxID=360622 RepID=A0AAD8JKY1_9APIA|nr:Tyrosine-protein phosphatase domain-containing protein [Heracleum sosnowskyi]
MSSLTLPNYSAFQQSPKYIKNTSKKIVSDCSIWGTKLCLMNGGLISVGVARKRCHFRVYAMSSSSSSAALKMNLNEYMVTLEKPLGIRFALSVDGSVFVHSLKKGGNAEKSRIIMVGDTVKKASESSGGKMIEIKDFGDAGNLTKEKSGSCSLVLERPFTPFPIHQLHPINDLDLLFNKGQVPVTTWNKTVMASNLRTSTDTSGNSGFVIFNSKFLNPKGWNCLNDENGQAQSKLQNSTHVEPIRQVVTMFSDEESADVEWAHGSFPLEEYIKALDRSKGDLYYNHSLGMRYSKITEQIYVGSCIQNETDVDTLSRVVGVTAVLNFQSVTEAQNWGINSKLVNESCQQSNILMINYPIREVNSFDMRKKLPFCVGLLLRLLKKNHRVYVTCTTGFDRSPACVIAYLHWMTDTSLHAAYSFVTGLHSCRPDRPAIAWATWDLIAMVEDGKHDGPPSHAVTFVWIGHEGEDVSLVGDFTGNWKEPIKASHKGGPRFEAEVKLSQGMYYYKFIIGGQWRHSTASPTERDERGNLNNIIVVGDVASVRPTARQEKKDANVVKVIERTLTENERFMLAKAARCVAFSVCPIRLAPKI